MQYQDIIMIESGKRGDKPYILLRNAIANVECKLLITVYDVLSYLASGMTYEEILDDFSYLTKEDVLAF
ncbi:MAG: DUF433 domain-containing protein [Lyngbya sp. HA4199-MV5]|nr:DUF433 domain-containing protein [Lyngbya sp. HA4199-MV5]